MNISNIHTEADLFFLISQGEEDAFNQFYLTVLPEFSPYLYKLIKSEDGVKEVLQEALVRFWLSRHKLPEIKNPKAWLYRIISNECYRYLKKQSDYQRDTKPFDEQPAFDNNVIYQTEMDVSFRETKQLIRNAVNTLSARQKAIYQLSREEGLTIPEIAGKLGVSDNYVRKTLVLTLKLIKQRLIEAGIFLPVILLLMP